MEKITVLEAYTQFKESREGQPNPRLLDNLRTALKHCILPFYATYSPAELHSNFEGCLAQVLLTQLLKDASHLLDNLSKGIILSSSRKVSTGTINNYQSALLRFFRWIYANRWDDPSRTIVFQPVPLKLVAVEPCLKLDNRDNSCTKSPTS